jgi:hypothetical protein
MDGGVQKLGCVRIVRALNHFKVDAGPDRYFRLAELGTLEPRKRLPQ